MECFQAKGKAIWVFLVFAVMVTLQVLGDDTVDFDTSEGIPSNPDNATVQLDLDSGASESTGLDFKCIGCRIAADLLLSHHASNGTVQDLLKIASMICATIGIQSKEVCDGMVMSIGSQLFDILDIANGTVRSADICAMVSGGECSLKSKRLNNWKLAIPDLDVQDPPTPAPAWPSSDIGSRPVQKVLHLSDVHLQHSYTVGSRTDCGEPICCFPETEAMTLSTTSRAGPVGDYHCDLPSWTFERIMEGIARRHPDIAYVFLTGDFPAHDSWKQDRQGNLASTADVVRIISANLPDAKVFPTVGNHESFPVNMFPNPDIRGKYSPAWLYGAIADLYLQWLPGKKQQKTLRDAGYFTVSPRPGLRIISLNTNFCNSLNFWILINFDDPHLHLHWLYRQLHKAEVRGEVVHIIGHIPPGCTDCLGQWSHEYNRIVRRFRNTIAAQYFGHTHNDQFELFFGPSDQNQTIPMNTAFIAPSQTPVDGVNPAYRIYLLDGDHENTTNLILDHQTYWANLTALNSDPRTLESPIDLELEYRASADLGLPDLSPESWWGYLLRLAKDEKAFKQFYTRHFRGGPAAEKHCDKKCQKDLLCDLVRSSSKYGDPAWPCRELVATVENQRPREARGGFFGWWKTLMSVPLSLTQS